MAFEDRYLRLEAPLNQGVPTVFNLPFGLNVLSGRVILKATVTITNAGAAGTPIGEGGPIRLIRRIQILANKAAGSRYPNGYLVDCSPRSLLRYAMVERSGKFVGELSGNILGGGVAGVYPIYLSIPIYFASGILVNEMQTALNLNQTDSTGAPIYSSVQVKVDLAELLTEIFAGSGGTMVVNGLICWEDDRIALAKDSVPLRQEDHIALIQAAQETFVDPGMPNDGSFTSWLLLAEQGQPGEVLSDAILNRLEIQGGSLNFKEHWQEIRQAMIDDGFYDPSSTMYGQFFLDWTKGLLVNSNPAAGLQARMSVNNPSGAGLDQLRVYTRRVYGLGS